MRTKFAFLSALFLLFIGQAVFAQVTGTVEDADGFAVSDAEVAVRGGSASALTDENGDFSIDAQIGDVLVVTDMYGTTKDFNVSKNNLGILSFAAVELDVVQIKTVFDPTTTGESGMTVIGQEQLEGLAPSLSVDQMLSGKISGLHSVAQAGGAPGAVANVVVRGSMSLNGGLKSPLYVVNGAYMNEDDVNSINPNDIETISVLKEASQLAVYGSRGANGVVIIKTRSAKKGQTQIRYRAMVGISEMMKMSNFDVMSSNQLLNFQNELSQLTNADGSPVGVGIARTPEEIANLSQINTDWFDEFTKLGFQNSHYVSINTADDKISNNFSLGYDSNDGNVEYYNGFQRISGSLNRTVNISDRFKYGVNLAGAYTERDIPRDRNNAQSPFYSILRNKPYETLYQMDADGNVIYDVYGDPLFNQTVNDMNYGALDEMKYTNRQYRNFRIFGSAFASLEVLKNVTATSSFGATYDRDQQESFMQPRSHLAGLLGVEGSKWDLGADRLDYNWRNEVTYGNSWGDHNFSFTAATEFVKENYYRMYIDGEGFPNNYQTVLDLATTITQGSDTRRWTTTRFGYLGSASYDYDKKYMLSAYIRRDGTSLAGFNDQYGVFWGVSGAWDMAREEFLANSKAINEMRFSISYGEVGDDSALTRYANFAAMTPNGQWAASNPGLLNNNMWFLLNPDATWEINKKFNAGLDYELFNNRLSGNFTYFNDTRSDFLLEQQLPAEIGGYVQTLNAGELVNRGLEVELNYDILKSNSGGLNLGVYGNLTFIDYEVTDLNGEDARYPLSLVDSVHRVGGEPFEFFLVRYAGVDPDNGDALYYDIDGNVTNVYSESDRVALEGKSPFPEFYGGFGLTTEYKGFELVADFGYQLGAYMYNMTYHNLVDIYPGTNNSNKHVDAANYWQNPGDTNVFQKPSADGILTTDQFVEKNDFLLFRSLALAYTVNPDILKNTPVKGLKITGQVQNLAIWTKYNGNPIVGTGSSESLNTQSNGYVSGQLSLWNYPLSRAYLLGLNVTF